MGADGLLVNHAALEAAAGQLLSTASQIDDRLNQLESELDALRSGWTGDAQGSYLVAKRRWDAAIAEVIAVLREASALVTQSNSEYRAADLRGAARFD